MLSALIVEDKDNAGGGTRLSLLPGTGTKEGGEGSVLIGKSGRPSTILPLGIVGDAPAP